VSLGQARTGVSGGAAANTHIPSPRVLRSCWLAISVRLPVHNAEQRGRTQDAQKKAPHRHRTPRIKGRTDKDAQKQAPHRHRTPRSKRRTDTGRPEASAAQTGPPEASAAQTGRPEARAAKTEGPEESAAQTGRPKASAARTGRPETSAAVPASHTFLEH
jgi:hypothetical protein